MKRQSAVGPIVLLTCLAVLSSCSDEQAVDDEDAGIRNAVGMNTAGRDKSIPCVACHGAEGVSDYDAWPNLAGQNAAYLAKQMRDFRAGHRHDPWMSPMAGPLSDRDIDELADYFSSFPAQTRSTTTSDLEGRQLAQTCSACHGIEGIIDNPLWPNLAGQNARYLIKQLREFRDGSRADPVMTPLAQGLRDQDIEVLSAFYASL